MNVPVAVHLGGEDLAFVRGGNRLIFVDPRDRSRCLKVLRPDRMPAKKRRERAFPKNLKPLSSFDDNLEELRVYRRIQRAIGEAAYELVPRCYGLVQTDLGPALSCDLARDDDGRIAQTLKQYLWQNGRKEELEPVLANFRERWQTLGMPSRNLLLHNLVLLHSNNRPAKLLLIDGLGWPDLLPLAYYWPALARWKAARKLQTLDDAIAGLLARQAETGEFGYHGWLDDSKRGM